MDDPNQILWDEVETLRRLSVSSDELGWLVSTGQLNPISIRGRRLFLAEELKALVQTYQATQRHAWN